MTANRNHGMVKLPEGKTVGDLLPQYAGAAEIGPFGHECPNCPGCGERFTLARKPKLRIRLYPIRALAPVCIQYRLCEPCARQYTAGGVERDSVLAAIERFVCGSETAA